MLYKTSLVRSILFFAQKLDFFTSDMAILD